jgi:hypothetical protein
MIEVEREAGVPGLEIIGRRVDRRYGAPVVAAVLVAAAGLAAGRVGEEHGGAISLGRRQPIGQAAVATTEGERHRNLLPAEMLEHGGLVVDLVRGPPSRTVNPQHVPAALGLDKIRVVQAAMQKPASDDWADRVTVLEPGDERLGRERRIADGQGHGRLAGSI